MFDRIIIIYNSVVYNIYKHTVPPDDLAIQCWGFWREADFKNLNSKFEFEIAHISNL